MVSIIENEKKNLDFSNFKNLTFWDYYTLSNKTKFESKFEIVTLNKVLTQRKGNITIEDNLFYKRCRVQLYGNGIILRDEVLGKEIKTKKQQLCKEDDFLVAEIDAKFGGYGIVPKELENAIVSSHYFLFEINKKLLLPEFLSIIVKCDDFSKQVKATGSTNYAAIRPSHVLGYMIPLPSIDEQTRIVQSYNLKIKEAEEQEKKANNLEEEIEEYFLVQLGLKPFISKEKTNGFQLILYSELDRWDFFSTNRNIYNELKNSKFKLESIKDVFLFAKRSWNKEKCLYENFRYIEIGSIDPNLGILETKTIQTKKAPSRATQIVKEDDLIIGTTRPYLKKFAIVNYEYSNCICSSGFSIIEKSDNYYLPFLKQFLMSTYGIEQLKNRMTGGLYPAITELELKEIKIPFPKVERQIEIMNLIEEKKKEILTNKKNIHNLKTKAKLEFEKKMFNR